MKIVFNGITFVMAIWITIRAALGWSHPDRLEYTVLWALVSMTMLNALLGAIKEKLERSA